MSGEYVQKLFFGHLPPKLMVSVLTGQFRSRSETIRTGKCARSSNVTWLLLGRMWNNFYLISIAMTLFKYNNI